MRKYFIVLIVLAAFLVPNPVVAQSYDLTCPAGWYDDKSELGDGLEKVCVSNLQDATVMVFVAPGEDVGSKAMQDLWEEGMNEGERTFDRMLSETTGNISGSPSMTREYLGTMDGILVHSFATTTYNNGVNYVVQGTYDEERGNVLRSKTLECMKSFSFPNAVATMTSSNQQDGQSQSAKLVDRAMGISQDSHVVWGKAQGAVDSAHPDQVSLWEITTIRNVGLHFRYDKSGNGHNPYRVEIWDIPSSRMVTQAMVSGFEKIRVGPGNFQIVVYPVAGLSTWSCDWE